MSIVNLQRDAIFANLDTTDIVGYSADSLLSLDTFLSNSNAVVYDDFWSASADSTVVTSVASLQRKGMGLNLRQPVGDRTPYRVKAYVGDVGVVNTFALAIGYPPAVITGTDDIISEMVTLPFTSKFDEMIIVEALPDGDPLIDRAIHFAIVVNAPAGGIAGYFAALLSVQNLGMKPPTMAQAVS